jgi:hypothetical protein
MPQRGRFALHGLAFTFAGPGTPASVAELFLCHQFVTTIVADEAFRRGCPFGWCILSFRAAIRHRLISRQRREFRLNLFHRLQYGTRSAARDFFHSGSASRTRASLTRSARIVTNEALRREPYHVSCCKSKHFGHASRTLFVKAKPCGGDD